VHSKSRNEEKSPRGTRLGETYTEGLQKQTLKKYRKKPTGRGHRLVLNRVGKIRKLGTSWILSELGKCAGGRSMTKSEKKNI